MSSIRFCKASILHCSNGVRAPAAAWYCEVAWSEPPTCTGCCHVWQYCVMPVGRSDTPFWLISVPDRLLPMSRITSFTAPAAGVVPSAPRRTVTVLATVLGSAVISTRSPEASSRTSPFMNGLASASVIWVSVAAMAVATMAIRLRNDRPTIVKVVDPIGRRGERVTSGQRLTNQLLATTEMSFRISAWLSITNWIPCRYELGMRTSSRGERQSAWSRRARRGRRNQRRFLDHS